MDIHPLPDDISVYVHAPALPSLPQLTHPRPPSSSTHSPSSRTSSPSSPPFTKRSARSATGTRHYFSRKYRNPRHGGTLFSLPFVCLSADRMYRREQLNRIAPGYNPSTALLVPSQRTTTGHQTDAQMGSGTDQQQEGKEAEGTEDAFLSLKIV